MRSRVFALALAVIAVHVIDDAFVQPEPSTSAGDHLAPGLAQLGVLALAAAAYPRVRSGLQAIIAFSLGFVTTFGTAAEAGYYTLQVGPSGDDYTGLLALAAGLLLIGLAGRTLWTSRRLDDRRSRRYARRALTGFAAAVATFYVLVAIGGAYMLTHTARTGAPGTTLGIPSERVAFETTDGLVLEGRYVRSKNGAAVVAYPGRKEHVEMLARHGYGVVLFNRRGEGRSQGDPDRWAGAKDVEAAAGFLKRRPEVDPRRIGGIGLSLGGEMLLDAAARSKSLRAVVSEGAGTRSIRDHVDGSLMLPTWLTTTAALTVFSSHGPPPRLKDSVRRIAPRPLLLIYATHGLGGESLNRGLFEAARTPKILWEIRDATHTGGIDAHPREYERRVVKFFDRALLGQQ